MNFLAPAEQHCIRTPLIKLCAIAYYSSLPKMLTQNITRPAYQMASFFSITIVYSVVHHSAKLFYPRPTPFFPKWNLFHFSWWFYWKLTQKCIKDGIFFSKWKQEKMGHVLAYLSTELEQCKNIHQISKHHQTQVDMGWAKEFCFLGPSGFSLIFWVELGQVNF